MAISRPSVSSPKRSICVTLSSGHGNGFTAVVHNECLPWVIGGHSLDVHAVSALRRKADTCTNRLMFSEHIHEAAASDFKKVEKHEDQSLGSNLDKIGQIRALVTN